MLYRLNQLLATKTILEMNYNSAKQTTRGM